MKYYSTQRPIGPGSCPMNNIVEIKNFDKRKFCPEINRVAWGYIIYSQPLTEKEARDYELLCYKNPLTEEKCKTLMKALLKSMADGTSSMYNNTYFFFEMPQYEIDITRLELERISESDDPQSDLDEMIGDLEFSYAVDYLHGYIADYIRDKLQTKYSEQQVEERMEFIDEFVQEYCLAQYPSLANVEIQTVIALDTGDANYDFSTNTRENFCRDNSIAWLAKQQGCYDALNSAIANNINEYDEDYNLVDSLSPFVKTALAEMDEYNRGGMLVFLVSMSLLDFIKVKNIINSDKEINNSSVYKERTGEKWFVVTKESVCGLYPPKSGGGSLLDIKLVKDVKIKTKDIFDVWIDTGYRYPYGCNGRGYQISYSYDMDSDSFTGSIQFPKED